jgi:hypothetical protein
MSGKRTIIKTFKAEASLPPSALLRRATQNVQRESKCGREVRRWHNEPVGSSSLRYYRQVPGSVLCGGVPATNKGPVAAGHDSSNWANGPSVQAR